MFKSVCVCVCACVRVPTVLLSLCLTVVLPVFHCPFSFLLPCFCYLFCVSFVSFCVRFFCVCVYVCVCVSACFCCGFELLFKFFSFCFSVFV